MAPAPPSADGPMDFAIGLPDDKSPQGGSGKGPITARMAGSLVDMKLCVSPVLQEPKKALRNMAKAINVALQVDFLETPLDNIYQAARVKKGAVHIIHRDYIGLGDGVFATVGKALKSCTLTLRGPDAASPEGKAWIKEHGGGAFGGVASLLGRKLNFLQEFEDKVPLYVEQTLDRLEAKHVVTDWHRDEWNVTTTTIGLDVVITPAESD